MFPRAITQDFCSRCGRSGLFWDCCYCREAGLVRSVWQVVLLRIRPTGGYVAADVAHRVLILCGSPCFQTRVEGLSKFLRGPPYTYSIFNDMDRDFDDVLRLRLPIPRSRFGCLFGPRFVGLRSGGPGHRRTDACFFVLSRHIVGLLAPRGLRTRCCCHSVQRRSNVGQWAWCSFCTNAVMLDICHSVVVDLGRLPSLARDDRRDGDTEQILTQPCSSWEHW